MIPGRQLSVNRYYSKASFYVFLPVFELIVLGQYAVARVDKMFYVSGSNERLARVEEGREVS